MNSFYFSALSRASGHRGYRQLLAIATAIAGTSLLGPALGGTAHAQTPTPTPIVITVSSNTRQTLKGIGAAQPSISTEVDNDTNHVLRDKMMDLTYKDLKMTVLRLWVDAGKNGSVIPTSDDLASLVNDRYVTTGFIAAAQSRGATTLLLGPKYGDDEPVANYALRIAHIVYKLRTIYNVPIKATGLVNEPSGGTWTPDMIAEGVRTIKGELHAEGVDDVDVIAPESGTCDSTATSFVSKLKSDTTTNTNGKTTWENTGAVATHSYSMAASDYMAKLLTDNGDAVTGNPVKDYWMTEAGAVNLYGDDEPRLSEPISGPPINSRAPDAQLGATYLAARFLNDMNHLVTHWIWFGSFGQKPSFNSNGTANDLDGGQKLVNPSYDGVSVLIRPKYWFFKQLREAFPDGTVFRRSDSALDGDMLYAFNKRAHVNAAVGKAPDGSWRIAAVNLTPVQTDGVKVAPNTPKNYASSPYTVKFSLPGLGSTPVVFAVKRSRADGLGEATNNGTVTSSSGTVTITIQAHELVTLSSGKVVTSIQFYTRTGYAWRMPGGVFQGSNTDKDNGPWTTLATITTTPSDNTWNTKAATATTIPYRYLRYLSPDDSYGNVAEVRFYDSSGNIITGYPYGTPSTGNNAYDKTFAQVYDGSTSTYFDTGTANGGSPYAGIDTCGAPAGGLGGNGITGQYYSGNNFQTLVTTRVDPVISFNWGTGGPFSSVGPDNFSVRWQGQVQAVETGNYSFRVVADNGVTLYLNGTSVVSGSDSPNQWVTPSPIWLTAGQQTPIKYDFYENGGSAYARLEWQRPGQSSYEIVPKSQLYQ